ncbi:hypothetical protein GeomeDRAFT_3323 [Geobacter metallireducens RCH3]|nr:hypothetical protein GeomeDRAFT_3323 [Geobacter metallireducens RCH3]
MQSRAWRIEDIFFATVTVINHDRTGPLDTNQELVQFLVCMLAAHFTTLHVKDKKIAFRDKREILTEFCKGETAPQVRDDRQTDKLHARNCRLTNSSYILTYFNLGMLLLSRNRRNITGYSCWVPHHDGIWRDAFRNHSTRANHGIPANCATGKDSGIGTYRSALLNDCFGKLFRVLLAPWKQIVGKRDIGANEHVILNTQPIPDLHTTLDRDPITDNYGIFNETM